MRPVPCIPEQLASWAPAHEMLVEFSRQPRTTPNAPTYFQMPLGGDKWRFNDRGDILTHHKISNS